MTRAIHATLLALSLVPLSCRRETPTGARPVASSAAASAAAAASASASAAAAAAAASASAAAGQATMLTVAPGARPTYAVFRTPVCAASCADRNPVRLQRVGPTMVAIAVGYSSIFALREERLEPMAWWDEQVTIVSDKVSEALLREHQGLSYVDLRQISGRFPDDLWVDATTRGSPDGRVMMAFRQSVWRFQGQRYTHALTARPPLQTWTPDGYLSLAGPGAPFASGGGKTPLPGRRAGADGAPRLQALTLASSPGGTVLTAGADRESSGALALERWPAGQTAGQWLALPGPPAGFDDVRVQAQGSTVYLAAGRRPVTREPPSVTETPMMIDQVLSGARLLRIEGEAVTTLDLPADMTLGDLALAPDGTLWLALFTGKKAGIYRLEGASLVAARLPANFLPTGQLFARDHDRAYLGGSQLDSERTIDGVVYATSPASLEPREQPAPTVPPTGPEPPRGEPGSEATPTPLRPGCATPFVVLFAVSKNTPADFTYPATRDALTGWPGASKYRFVEYLFRGKQRTLGAVAPDAPAAEALAARIRDQIKGAAPATVCFAPAQVVRALPLGG